MGRYVLMTAPILVAPGRGKARFLVETERHGVTGFDLQKDALDSFGKGVCRQPGKNLRRQTLALGAGAGAHAMDAEPAPADHAHACGKCLPLPLDMGIDRMGAAAEQLHAVGTVLWVKAVRGVDRRPWRRGPGLNDDLLRGGEFEQFLRWRHLHMHWRVRRVAHGWQGSGDSGRQNMLGQAKHRGPIALLVVRLHGVQRLQAQCAMRERHRTLCAANRQGVVGQKPAGNFVHLGRTDGVQGRAFNGGNIVGAQHGGHCRAGAALNLALCMTNSPLPEPTESDPTLVLGFESSCDETGVALVAMRPGEVPLLLAHALHSQVDMHQAFGGVVPELASRDHIRRALPLTQQVLAQAQRSLREVDVVAYTRGPGLAGALLVGAGVACALAAALDKPVLGVHHLEGHLLSPFLSADPPQFPFVALLVSGGHTQLMRVDGVGRYELLGETIDDAAGEAFDKSAKLMGLGYPGGPALAALAANGDPQAYALPRPLLHSGNLDFSFAGLKTAVLVQSQKMVASMDQTVWNGSASGVKLASGATPGFENLPLTLRADLAASTQAAIADVLVKKSLAALKLTGLKRLVVAGGVGANTSLRSQLNAACAQRGVRVHYPELHLCTDNGAMIAMAAAMRLQSGLQAARRDYAFDVKPRWPLQAI